MKKNIERIEHMEVLFDAARAALEAGEIKTLRTMLPELGAYMESGAWLEDYEMDERGELPMEMKRGVLAQDGLYDLLMQARKKDVDE